MLKLLLLCLLTFGLVSPSQVDDDFAALEKALETAYSSKTKKSLDDFSTDELISELKREVDKLSEHHRPTFHEILSKKSVNDWVGLERKRVLEQPTPDDCKDARDDCDGLKSYCLTHKEKLQLICNKTCGYCAPCVDKYLVCSQRAMEGECVRQRERMTANCPKSCGICKAPAPPLCSKTKYGCCWNKETIKQNDKGENCPACQDKYVYVCETFKDDCFKVNDAGAFMLHNCPKKCGLCDSKCVDAGGYKLSCSFWKKNLNWCNAKPTLMRHFCPKTCRIC